MNYKKLLVFGFVLLSYLGFSQNTISIGLNGGYDYNYGHLLNPRNGVNINAFPDFNIGADVSWYLGKRVRIRGEFQYANMAFTRDLVHPYNNNDDNIKTTKLSVNRLGFSPNVDFRMFSIGKFDAYITAGLKADFNMGDFARSFTYGGEKSYNNYIDDEYGSDKGHIGTMTAALGGFIFKYNVSQNWSVTMKPQYTSFFNFFYNDNRQPLQRGSLNFGVEYSF